MLDKLDATLSFQQQALSLRHQRQSILSANIAHADTPGYQARDIDFSAQLEKKLMANSVSGKQLSLAVTSAKHIAVQPVNSLTVDLLYRVPQQAAMDGNTVDMDIERSHFADNSVKYQTDLSILNGQIKSMMAVMQ
ncbi:flagellar basal body rod protein FlgB [Arsenophonus sp.]|uniref:flagellar basal body rod protein FlgB n=1 Tax=Arsenophonus sp. TaxID=1872640 RepID=UPI00285A7590|nr:flagellar basal body rod protein FlgB [Arsenophonus sp.]MDR5612470.1 flagellar basal body rod protein FlgB [Arsenophonus sp.]MDR5615806.1 flagellar basal body rod protein FlgB [Arsenophonus sp.]